MPRTVEPEHGAEDPEELPRASARRAVVSGAAGKRLRVEHVNPRQVVDQEFEEVSQRAPDLRRLIALGCRPPSMSLEAILRDAWAHPPIPPGRTRRDT